MGRRKGRARPSPAEEAPAATPEPDDDRLAALEAENRALRADKLCLEQRQRAHQAQRRMAQQELGKLRAELLRRDRVDREEAAAAERARGEAALQEAAAQWAREREELVRAYESRAKHLEETLRAAKSEIATCRDSLQVHVRGQADAVEELVRVRQEQYRDRSAAAEALEGRAAASDAHREAQAQLRAEFDASVAQLRGAMDALQQELAAARAEAAELRRRPPRTDDQLLECIDAAVAAAVEDAERAAGLVGSSSSSDSGGDEAAAPAPAPAPAPAYHGGRRRSVVMLEQLEEAYHEPEVEISPAAAGHDGGALLTQIEEELARARGLGGADEPGRVSVHDAVRRHLEAQLSV